MVFASLEKGQSQSRIKAQLEQVKAHYTNWKNTLEQAAKESGGSVVGTQPSVPDAPPPGAVRRKQ